MPQGELIPLFAGAVALGFVHGIEPGHGWPVAASYALDQTHKWRYGFAASALIGIGHLVSSLAMVGAFFYAKAYFQLTDIDEPLSVLGLSIGGPVSIVAGLLLVGLGIREYRYGHSHGTGHDHAGDHVDAGDQDHTGDHRHAQSHDHGTHQTHDSHDHPHNHSHDRNHGSHDHGHDRNHGSHDHGHDRNHESDAGTAGILGRVKHRLGGSGGHAHASGFESGTDDDRGLLGIAWFAFVLGFAHEEEFEIIGLCAGSSHCLALMTAYALTVIIGIVGLTLLLVAGYEEYEETVERYTPYLPLFSATVLVVMGLGFIAGLL